MLEGLTPPAKFGQTCKVAQIAETLSDSDKEILFGAIADKENWAIKTLMRELAHRGLSISATPLTSHRAQTCSCFR